MKVRFNRWYNSILTALLSLLGYSCSSENSLPVEMYGVPSADYQISGTVTNDNGQVVQGIKTSVKQISTYEGKTQASCIDSVMTDANGHYDVSVHIFPMNKEIKLLVEDVDGDANGAYQNDTIDIDYNNAQKIKDGEDVWNNGTFAIKQDIKLKKK